MIWLERPPKAGICEFCRESYEARDPVGVVRYGKTEKRFHPGCWVEHLIAILGEHAPAGKPGRKPLEMAPEQKEVRNKLIRAYAAARHRIKKLEELGDLERAEFYKQSIVVIAQQIEGYGGRPHKWNRTSSV